MRILFLAKRRYTNKDALREKFGRVYQLPLAWTNVGHAVGLALLDYRALRQENSSADGFEVRSLPLLGSILRLTALSKEWRPDVIIASGDCFVGIAGLHLAKAMKVPFVFDVYDDYSSFGSYRAFLGWDAFRYLLGRANLVFYASNSLADRHRSRSPWAMVPNGVDPRAFHPMPVSQVRDRLGIAPSTKLVGYFGSMEPDRGVADLVAAVGKLHAIDPGVRMLLCGTPLGADTRFPSWVDYRGVVPHSAMAAYVNACDVLALPYRRSPTMDMGASCKIAEYLLCDRPLVATDTPNFTSNFPTQASELGAAMCRPSDPTDLARAIFLQLQEARIVSQPEGHTWPRIAAAALAAIVDLVDPA